MLKILKLENYLRKQLIIDSIEISYPFLVGEEIKPQI
jgi:hypothetical protein